MLDFMRPLEPQTYAFMRIVTGFLFFWHGMQKIVGIPPMPPMPPDVPPPPAFILPTAGSIELVGGGLVMIGLLARPAAFLCSGLMAFAYWLGHGTKALLPINNGGELAVIYCFVFLFISARGAGIWSLDGDR
jgi:putative oxidoreductase